jgi:hypothetical protein
MTMNPHPDSRTARFWTYINNGWVKISLRPEQTIEWSYSHDTDEGYASGCYTWRHCGLFVVRELETSSRDCDGPHGSFERQSCELNQLAAHVVPSGQRIPAWRQLKARQYDAFAEAMNY